MFLRRARSFFDPSRLVGSICEETVASGVGRGIEPAGRRPVSPAMFRVAVAAGSGEAY
jgi:hypothetical protein